MVYSTSTDNALLATECGSNTASIITNTPNNINSNNNNNNNNNNALSENTTQQQESLSPKSGIASTINTTAVASNAKATTTATTTQTTTSNATVTGNAPQSSIGATVPLPPNALFCEEVTTVTNLFDKWNDCERTVVMYALLKRLRYPNLKFLQYSIDNNLTQNLGTSQTNLTSVVIDINANNPAYLQNLLNAYETFQASDVVDVVSSSSSSDKDAMQCYGSDFQITTTAQCDERKLYARKEDILHDVLNMLPLLKPGNDEAKLIYMKLIPVAVKDTLQQIVPTELVQQIFSYLLIHPAISSEDRRSLNIWLRHLEDHIQAAAAGITNRSYFIQPSPDITVAEQLGSSNGGGGNASSSSGSVSSAGGSSSTASCSSVGSASLGNLAQYNSSTSNSPMASSTTTTTTNNSSGRSNDWQTIAPPSKQHKQQSQQPGEWRSASSSGSTKGTANGSSSINQLCDNLNGITLNELASSQNSLGLALDSSSLVNGVVAGAAGSNAASLFGGTNGPMINILGGTVTDATDDHDTSFSKNGTEILDFEPSCDSCVSSGDATGNNSGSIGNNLLLSQLLQPPSGSSLQLPQQLPYASILMSNVGDQFGEINRWSLDSKIAALKTRRSNSLTTQTISSSSSSSNSSVITVNDICSNSTENLAQYANKPRSFSLSIEHQRGTLANSGSDTRLDDFKPGYIKFHTRNLGMSGIGLWLKSLRLHKYIELFKNMTYEEMLQISEEFLQSVGVTKGASHKLALCIEKLKDRTHVLTKLEQELHKGQVKVSAVIEELTNIVLTPMKPVESVESSCGEENVGLGFLRVIDLVSNTLQHDPYCVQDDETLSVFMWILDRSIHNEAFVNHANQLKELKFKLSKLKMSMVPKLHHVKTAVANGANINKPRWNGKARKCDSKNGSNDRINHRKNSNDMLNFSLSCLQHPLTPSPHHQQLSQQQSYGGGGGSGDYNTGYGGPSQVHQQYKSSSYPNFITNSQQPLKHHQPPPPPQPLSSSQSHAAHQQQQQQQQMQKMLQQHNHFPALPAQHTNSQAQPPPPPPHHRRSLNNLIVVAGGPQQPQQLIFKPGQGVLTTTSSDNLLLETAAAMARNQQRKASLNGLSSGTSVSVTSVGEQQQPKKTMAAVVMVSNSVQKQSENVQTPQILINNNNNNNNSNNNNINNNNNNNILNNNLINHQQLQLLAAAAAAVGHGSCLCSGDGACAGVCGCSPSFCQTNNNNNNNLSQLEVLPSQPQIITNMNMSLKDKYHPATVGNSMTTGAPVMHEYKLNDYKSLEQLETLCRQMTEQAMN